MNFPSSSPSPFDDDHPDHDLRIDGDRPIFFQKLLRYSITVAVISFVVGLIGAVIGNNAAGDTRLETIAFGINRYGMLVLLLACVGIFIAIRGPLLSSRLSAIRMEKGKTLWSTWFKLFVINCTALLILPAILLPMLLILQANWILVLLFPVLPILISLMLTIAIWHRGVVRAYAIGFLATSLLSWISASTSLVPMAMISQNWNYSGNYGSSFPGPPSLVWLFFSFLIVPLCVASASGLACAGYVTILERTRRLQRDSTLKS